MKIFFLSVLILLASCSNKKKELLNQTPQGHDELYSTPDSNVEKVPSDQKRVVIASTNDIEGHLAPHTLTFKDQHHKNEHSIGIGGADFISSYFKILRKQYQNVILVDAGDIFSNEVKGNVDVRNFYSSLEYSAITVGLRDFSLKLDDGSQSSSQMIKTFAKDSSVPLLLSNMYELKTGRGVEWKGTKPYHIVEIGGVKVGILGLVPNDLVTLTPVDNRVGLYVESMIQSTLKFARLMRSLGAQMIVVLTHQGLVCGKELSGSMNLPLNKVNFEPTKSNVCDTSGALGSYLSRLPPHLVDVVIGGRHHQKMANYINGTLVMSGFEQGKSFNYAEFYFDKNGKIIPASTVVHQPVMVCREFFKETKDCYYEDASIDHKERIPATFLGEEVKSDEEMKKKFPNHFIEPKFSSVEEIEIHSALKAFNADLVYLPNNSMTTQLVSMDLTGRELAKILEEDFHQAEKADWKPEPFELKNDVLKFVIHKKSLDLNRTYKVLFDLESFQTRNSFHKYMAAGLIVSHPNSSWMTTLSHQDAVDTQMAGNQRQ